MTIDVPCPNCGTVYTVRRDLIGKRTKCTRCGAPFSIIEPTAVPAPPVARTRPTTPRPAPVQPQTQPPQAPPAFQPPQQQQPLEALFPDFPAYVPQPTRANPAAEVREAPAPTAQRPSLLRELFAFDRTPSNRSFRVLRFLAKAFAISAAISLATAAYWAIILLVALFSGTTYFSIMLVLVGPNLYGSLGSAAGLFIAAQLIRLGLQLEQNTREASEANRRLADHLTAIEVEN